MWLSLQSAADAEATANLLSEDEQERAAAFTSPADRGTFVLMRVHLRRWLGKVLSCAPHQVPLIIDPGGKPLLAGAAFAFNVSHADEWGLIALARQPVGIDIERIDPRVNLPGLTRRFLSAHEQTALALLEPAERMATFYRCWTRKEALVKASGVGLAHNLASLSVWQTDDGGSVLTQQQPTDISWHLVDLPPPPGYQAALASCEIVTSVQMWRTD